MSPRRNSSFWSCFSKRSISSRNARQLAVELGVERDLALQLEDPLVLGDDPLLLLAVELLDAALEDQVGLLDGEQQLGVEVEVPQAVLELAVAADQRALVERVEALDARPSRGARASIAARRSSMSWSPGRGLAELRPDPLEDLGQPVVVAQHQLARAVVHLLAQAGEQEVDLVHPVGGPGAAGVGVKIEPDELGEDLLVVILHPPEELPQQVGRDFGILLARAIR